MMGIIPRTDLVHIPAPPGWGNLLPNEKDMRKILLIDDRPAAGANIREILALSQYTVLTATSAAAAIAVASKEHPGLVICDLSLAGADAAEVIRTLQAEPALQFVPLLVLTESTDKNQLRRLMTLGADDCLAKPFDGIELLRAVDACLERQQRMATQSAIPSKSTEALIPDAATPAIGPGLAWRPDDRDIMPCKKKTLLYTEGQRASQVFYIVSGKVRTFRTHSDGKELITGIHGAGDCVGYAAALEGGVHRDNAQVFEDSGIIVISRQEFIGIFNTDSGLARQLIQWLARHASEKEAGLINLAYSSLRKKVANGILHLSASLRHEQGGKRYITISRDNLAALVGSAPESLTRTLGEFRKERLIEISDGRIWLLDEEGLRKMLN